MNAPFAPWEQAPDADDAAEPAYGFTFGHYTQAGPWSDRRSLTWADLGTLLTTHEIGPKEGTCIVPAVFRDTRRHKNDADQIDAVFLDSDSGATLEEIRTAISACESAWKKDPLRGVIGVQKGPLC